jgi:hypothetical protein
MINETSGLETVRRGEFRAATSNRNDGEADIEVLCQSMGTSTEGAFRAALDAIDIDQITREGRMSSGDREALATWRGHLGMPKVAVCGTCAGASPLWDGRK